MSISSVIFDFGSTLIRESAFCPEEGQRFLLSRATSPHKVRDSELRDFDGKVFPDMLQRRERSGLDFPLTQYLNLMQACLGIRWQHDLEELAFGCWLRQYKPILEKGAAECLQQLRKNGLRLGLLSNTILSGKSVRLGLGKLGILQFFDAVLCSSDIGYRKPDQLIFRAILGLLGAQPGESAMVGDNLRDDIAGAASVGMTTVWYNCGGLPQEEIKPDYIVQDLTSVPRVLGIS